MKWYDSIEDIVHASEGFRKYCVSLCIIVYHCLPLCIIVYHCVSLCTIVYHCVLLCISTFPSTDLIHKSIRCVLLCITMYHCATPQCTSAANPCSTGVVRHSSTCAAIHYCIHNTTQHDRYYFSHSVSHLQHHILQ